MKQRRFFQRGFVDVASLVVLGFMLASFAFGASQVIKETANFDTRSKAAGSLPDWANCKVDSDCRSGNCDKDLGDNTLACLPRPVVKTPTSGTTAKTQVPTTGGYTTPVETKPQDTPQQQLPQYTTPQDPPPLVSDTKAPVKPVEKTEIKTEETKTNSCAQGERDLVQLRFNKLNCGIGCGAGYVVGYEYRMRGSGTVCEQKCVYNGECPNQQTPANPPRKDPPADTTTPVKTNGSTTQNQPGGVVQNTQRQNETQTSNNSESVFFCSGTNQVCQSSCGSGLGTGIRCGAGGRDECCTLPPANRNIEQIAPKNTDTTSTQQNQTAPKNNQVVTDTTKRTTPTTPKQTSAPVDTKQVDPKPITQTAPKVQITVGLGVNVDIIAKVQGSIDEKLSTIPPKLKSSEPVTIFAKSAELTQPKTVGVISVSVECGASCDPKVVADAVVEKSVVNAVVKQQSTPIESAYCPKAGTSCTANEAFITAGFVKPDDVGRVEATDPKLDSIGSVNVEPKSEVYYGVTAKTITDQVTGTKTGTGAVKAITDSFVTKVSQ